MSLDVLIMQFAQIVPAVHSHLLTFGLPQIRSLPHNEIFPVDIQPSLVCLHFCNEFPLRNEIFNIE